MKKAIVGVLIFFACSPNDKKEGFVFDEKNITVTNASGYRYVINKKNMLPIEVQIIDKQFEMETMLYYNDFGELERRVLSDKNGKIIKEELYSSDKRLTLKKFYNEGSNFIEHLKYEKTVVNELFTKDGKKIYLAHLVDGEKILESVIIKSNLLQYNNKEVMISLEPALTLLGEINYSIESGELDYHVEKHDEQSLLHVKGDLELYNELEIQINYVPLMPKDTISAFSSKLVFDLEKNRGKL